MKRFPVIIVLSFLAVLLLGTGFVFADGACLNENGQPYSNNAPRSSYCYIKQDDKWVPTSRTLGAYLDESAAQQPVVPAALAQPVTETPKTQTPKTDTPKAEPKKEETVPAAEEQNELPETNSVKQEEKEEVQQPAAIIEEVKEESASFAPAVEEEKEEVIPEVKEEPEEVIPAFEEEQEEIIPAVEDESESDDPEIEEEPEVIIPAEEEYEPAVDTEEEPEVIVPAEEEETAINTEEETETIISEPEETAGTDKTEDVITVPVIMIPEEGTETVVSDEPEGEDHLEPEPEDEIDGELLTASNENSEEEELAEEIPEGEMEELEVTEGEEEETAEETGDGEEEEETGETESVPEITKIAITAPADESTVKELPVTLSWDSTFDGTENIPAVEYTVNIAGSDKTVSCDQTSCSCQVEDLANGTYTWSVSAKNSSDEKISDSAKFTLEVKKIDPPKAPVQECPKGEYHKRNLGFYWAPSEGADKYVVNWKHESGEKGSITLSNSDKTCQNGRCIAYAYMPKTGKYSWTVTAINEAGKASSGKMSYKVLTNITTPDPYSPKGSISNRKFPVFSWADVKDKVKEYRLQIVGKWNGCVYLDRWYEATCQNGACYVQLNNFLPSGSYSWRVRGNNGEFDSNWSKWMDFSVACDYCYVGTQYYGSYSNTVPTPSYPVSTITTKQPFFQWAALTGAVNYRVVIMNSNGGTIHEAMVPSSSCNGETCTYQSTYVLPGNGSYTWSVDAYGPNSVRWGSSAGSFRVEIDEPLGKIEFLVPENHGYLDNETPMIYWTDPVNASLFSLEILNNAGETLLMAQITPDDAWCDGTSCSIEFTSIPDGQDYQIRLTPYSDYNTPGETVSLTFSKGLKPVELISPKMDAVVSSRPLFRWKIDSGDEAYTLHLVAENGEDEVMILKCNENGMNCENSEAFFSPALTLDAGTYTAMLGVENAAETATEVRFIVQ